MNRIHHVVALALVVLMTTSAYGALPDRWVYQGSVPVGAVKSFDVGGDAAAFLFDRAVALSAPQQSALRLAMRDLTSLSQSYDDVLLSDTLLCLLGHGGEIGLASVNEDGITVITEQEFGDSLLSVAVSGTHLYCAEGVEGIRIVDLENAPVLRTVGRATHGGDYTQLAVMDTLLVAVDALNGIDLYGISGDSLSYLRTILTDWPVSDFARDGREIVICYGRNEVDSRPLDGADANSGTRFRLAHRIGQLEEFDDAVLAVADDGKVMQYNWEDSAVVDLAQMAYPPRKVRANSTSCLALDALGRLTEYAGPDLSSQSELVLSNLPTAMAATGRGLVVARVGQGIALLDFEESVPSERQVYETGLGFSSLCASGDFVFAAVTGTSEVMVFDLSDGSTSPVMTADMQISSRELFVERERSGWFKLVGIGQTSARSIRIDVRARTVELLWLLESPFLVNGGYCDKENLILTSETGEIDYYCLDCGFPKPIFRGSISIGESPRSVVMIGESDVAVASESGVNLVHYSGQFWTLEPIGTILPISSAWEMIWDSDSKMLAVAGGNNGICYLDMSDPFHPGIVSRIASSESTTGIALYGDRLYGLSRDALNGYRADYRGANVSVNGMLASEPFPNPFNSGTLVEVATSAAGVVSYQIVDVLGRTVRQGEVPSEANSTRIIWDGADEYGHPAASGVYLLRLAYGESRSVRKMLLVK
jgi:hypothetical protein